MNQKWNLQDIKPAEPRRRGAPTPNQVFERPAPKPLEREDEEEVGTIEITNGKTKTNKGWLLAFIIFFTIIGGGFVFSMMTAGADVTVYPRHREPNVNANFTAYRVPKADQLSYEIMTLEAEGERQVKASGQESAKEQAGGTIFIYNKFQEKPIRLVTNTRFESENGLIYRIKDSAIVPGYTKDTSGAIVPGVITAQVFADESGENYNIKPGKFTVPGFKGEPEFDGIYGESTEAFTGGFDGQRFIIADEDLKTAEQALRTELRNSLLERIDSEKPAGFAVFKDAVTFTYVTLPAIAYGQDLATLKEKVIMRIPIFKAEDFATFIAAATVPGYEGGPVRINDINTLSFSYTNATTSASDISVADSVDFKLTGRPQIIWTYDQEKLKADLLNANKTALTTVLGGYPAIEKAEATIRPFWKSKFPIKIEKVKVIEVVQ